jgi:hypothetical protein
MTGRTGHVSCPGHARPRVPFPRQSPYLCTVWFADADTSASGSNHTFISDRLPDPAQFARCFRILHNAVACEGSHSSRPKVTFITRRTVYLIQSGRKPRVSWPFPGSARTGRRTRVRCRRVVRAGVAVNPRLTAAWGAGMRRHRHGRSRPSLPARSRNTLCATSCCGNG